MRGGRARRRLLAAAALGGAGAAIQWRHMRAIAADPEQARLRTAPSGRPLSVRSRDGTQLHVEVFGPQSGPPVLLAHGWTESLRLWTLVIERLGAKGMRVVAYDLRGHGASGRAAGDDYSLARFGEDVEAVLAAALPGERATIAGHSLGAMSIVAWAEHHDVRARAGAAALVNTGVGELLAEQLLIGVPAIANALNRAFPPAGLLSARAPLPRFSTPLSHALVRYTAFGPAASHAQVAFYERMLIACPPDVRATVGITLSELDLRHAVPRLNVPTLVVAGDCDRLTPPAHARRIAAQLPQLHSLVILEQTGHMSPLERPDAISEGLAELAALAGLEARHAIPAP
ncbi:MAG: alpha/beta fold hydrolase [Solirubrobacteraceae bacterium]